MPDTTHGSTGARVSGTDPEASRREARQRFINSFPKRCDSIELLLATIAARGPRGSSEPLRELAHQLAATAGAVGFPNVSERASELEMLAAQADKGFNLEVARGSLETIREIFAREMAIVPPAPGAAEGTPAAGARVLVANEATADRQAVIDYLRLAGHDPASSGTGNSVVDAVRVCSPRIVVLDDTLPAPDGASACRLLKTDPQLAMIPVILITAGPVSESRLAGLALGPDDYVVKPVDMRELLLRIDLLLCKSPLPAAAAVAAAGPVDQRGPLLPYEAFVAASRGLLRQLAATFVLLRVTEKDADDLLFALRVAVRHRDIMAQYDGTHVMLLLGGAPPGLVRHRVEELIARQRDRGMRNLRAGISFSPLPGDKTIEALVAEADEALAEARHRQEPVVVKGDRPRPENRASGPTVLIVEDDPEAAATAGTELRAAGYRVIPAAEPVDAMHACSTATIDVVLLGMMAPGAGAFEVLERLQQMAERRPRVAVSAAKGREADVTRAFEMGADDYIVKPFDAGDLLMRMGRLLR